MSNLLFDLIYLRVYHFDYSRLLKIGVEFGATELGEAGMISVDIEAVIVLDDEYLESIRKASELYLFIEFLSTLSHELESFEGIRSSKRICNIGADHLPGKTARHLLEPAL